MCQFSIMQMHHPNSQGVLSLQETSGCPSLPTAWPSLQIFGSVPRQIVARYSLPQAGPLFATYIYKCCPVATSLWPGACQARMKRGRLPLAFFHRASFGGLPSNYGPCLDFKTRLYHAAFPSPSSQAGNQEESELCQFPLDFRTAMFISGFAANTQLFIPKMASSSLVSFSLNTLIRQTQFGSIQRDTELFVV